MNCCCPTVGRAIAPASAVTATTAVLRSTEHMAVIPAGSYRIGSEGPEVYPADGEGPVRCVSHRGFRIDRTAVTNTQFAAFVADSGYVTEAETIGWSFVFFAQVHPRSAEGARQAPFGAPKWWSVVPGACWRCPDGPGSDWRERADHPVVHVSWDDASACARWAGKRLPDEAEWEIATRGGLDGALYPWGDELMPDGVHRCNIWQGRFPIENSGQDGWLSTAPATSFAPNGYGLFNTVGNTWEWTAGDWAGNARLKAMRGGSYLCHESYCYRYRVSARTGNAANAVSSHLGFRCAADLANDKDII